MIEAVSGNAAAASLSAPASAGGDIFFQILSAVMSGLASGAVNPEVCPAEDAELNLAGEEPSAPSEALETGENFIPMNGKTEAAGAGTAEAPEADTAAFMMASALLAAPYRAAGAAMEEKAAPAGTEIKSPARAGKASGADAPAAAEKTSACRIEEAPAAYGAVPMAAEPAAGREKKAAGAAAVKASGGESEAKNIEKPAEKSAAARLQPPSEDLAAKFYGDKAGQSGERQPAREQKPAALSTGPAGEAAVKAVKEALPEKAAAREPKGTGADGAGLLKEALVFGGAGPARGQEALSGRGLSAAGVERIASAAERLETSGSGRLSLEINEPGLGKVRVEMALRGGELNISLEVESKEAGRFLSAKVPELVEALSQRGVNSGVQLFTGADGGRNGAGREERAPARRFANAASETAEQEAPMQEEGRISLYV